jgi:four helix bundle protein
MTYNQTGKTERIEGEERQERIPTFFRFEDLRIYHKSLDYVTWLQDVTMLFPDSDKSQLAVRFNDAARNIALYIAEGSARNKTQFVYYLKMAKSSIRQCVVYTTLAHKANLLSDESEEESRTQLMEMTKMLGALISSLQRSNNGYHNNNYNNNGNHNHNGNYNNNYRYGNNNQDPMPYDNPNEDPGFIDQY